MSIANASITANQQATVPVTVASAVEMQNLRNDIVALAKALVALQQRVADSEVSTNEVRPRLVALKVHTESIPQALRELRRGDAALQKKLDEFESRLRALEEKSAGAAVRG
jgi:hypothetical protein